MELRENGVKVLFGKGSILYSGLVKFSPKNPSLGKIEK
jgi:hypothetical protein